MKKFWPENIYSRFFATNSAIAREDVSPGDSIPRRVTMLPVECITKSFASTLGRIPEYPGMSSRSSTLGQYVLAAFRNSASRFLFTS